MGSDDVIIQVEDTELHISQEALAGLCSGIVLHMLYPDVSNTYAGLIGSLRLAMKALLRPVLPKMLKDLYAKIGRPAPEIPRAKEVELFVWLVPHLATVGIHQLANFRWEAQVGDNHADPEKRIYEIRALTAQPVHSSANSERAGQLATTT